MFVLWLQDVKRVQNVIADTFATLFGILCQYCHEVKYEMDVYNDMVRFHVSSLFFQPFIGCSGHSNEMRGRPVQKAIGNAA